MVSWSLNLVVISILVFIHSAALDTASSFLFQFLCFLPSESHAFNFLPLLITLVIDISRFTVFFGYFILKFPPDNVKHVISSHVLLAHKVVT